MDTSCNVYAKAQIVENSSHHKYEDYHGKTDDLF